MTETLDALRQDLRYGWRSLTRSPIACAVAVVSLAAGIGATTATLTARNALFYNPPPLYAQPAQLSWVSVTAPDRAWARVPAPLYRLWTKDGAAGTGATGDPSPQPSPRMRGEGAPADVAFAAAAQGRPTALRTQDRAETVTVRSVTPNLFPLLGAAPLLGRAFDDTSAREMHGPTPVMLSERLWFTLFDRRPNVLGTVLWLDSQPHVVIGVMPAPFWFGSLDAPVWRPLDVGTLGEDDALDVVARRPSGVTHATLTDRLQAGLSDYVQRLPSDQRRLRVEAASIAGTPLGRMIGYGVLMLITAAVLFTLLIACTNISVLMIAQWTAREQEIAIRASLGASRWRVIRTLLTESVLIALLGGALGVCFTFALRGLIVRGGGFAAFFDLAIDWSILWRALVVTLAAGLLTGIAPALYETRRLHTNPLRLTHSSDRVRQRWRRALVAFEIATTMALLVVAGTMVSAYRRGLVADLGFDTHGLLAVRVEQAAGVPRDEILARLRSVPGVASAAAASAVPVGASGPMRAVAIDAAASHAALAEHVVADPDYFATLGLALRAGRGIAREDLAGGMPVAVVNEVLAARLWPGRTPIGAQLWTEGRAYQVVGVVAGHAAMALRPRGAAFYLPLAQHALPATQHADATASAPSAAAVSTPQKASANPAGRVSVTAPTRMVFVMRTAGDPAALVSTVRRELLGIVTVVPAVYTLDQVRRVGAEEVLASTWPLVPLIGTGMLLTAAGIYGVLAFAIARRSRELAVRLALGASRGDLLRLITWQSARLIGTGSLFGIGATFALTRVAQGSGGLFDSPGWAAFVIPMVIVAGIGTVATWIPARRTIRIDPATVLRTTV